MTGTKCLQLIAVIVAAASWLTTNLLTLTAYPPITCDEVSYSSPAAQFLLNGKWGTQTDAGRDGLSENAVALGRLYLGSIALSFWLLGRSAFAARLVTVVAWALGIWGVFLLGRRFYTPAVGWLSAALMAASWVPLLQGHVARPDMTLASAVVWVTLLLWFSLEAPSVLKLGSLGLAAGLLLEIHLNGIHFIAAASLIFGAYALRQRWPWRWWAAFGLGMAAAGLIWLTLHAWAAPSTSLTGQHSAVRGALNVAAQLQSLAGLPQFIVEYYLWGGGPGLFTALIVLPGLGVALWRRTRADKLVLAFVALSLLVFGLLRYSKPAYYTIIWMPLLVVLASRGLGVLAETLPPLPLLPTASRRLWVISGGVLAVYLAGSAYLLIKFSDHSFDRITAQLQNSIEPGAVVFGNPRAWFALPQRTIIDDLQLAIISGRSERPLTKDGVYELLAAVYRPDYLLLGSSISCFAAPVPEAQFLRQIAEEHCQVVTVIAEPWYEPNTLYRCSFAGSSN